MVACPHVDAVAVQGCSEEFSPVAAAAEAPSEAVHEGAVHEGGNAGPAALY